MADPKNDGTGAPPSHIHVEGAAAKKTNWLPWILAGLGLLALLFALSQCGRRDAAVVAPVPVDTAETTVVRDTVATGGTGTTVGDGVAAAVDGTLTGTSGIGAYLAGTDALPRTFVFERMYFDTASSDIRADTRDEVDAVAAALNGNAARIRVVGYADARGDAAANATLGKARADGVKAALVSQGIAATRIETASGGEAAPAATNATATGQAGNRRTELVVLSR